jgi:hypothetical protein
MEVNADRKGPKDMMDLAVKANAVKAFIDSERALKEGTGSQETHDDNFEHLMSVHDNDPEKLRATVQYVRDMLAKGKMSR